MAEAPGLEEVKKLRFAGFSDDDISEWRAEETRKLSAGGFDAKEIKDYFGDKEPDTTPIKNYVNEGIAKMKAEQEGKEPRQAEGFIDAFMGGLQMSTAGLAIRGESPDIVNPENAGMAMNIGSQIGMIAGDIPAMVAGGFLGSMAGAPVGAAAGSVVPVVGTLGGAAAGAAVGSGAGAFAMPTALRKIMMDHYEKGDIKTGAEFWERLSSTAWETMKSAAVGGATFGIGRAVGGAVVKAGGSQSVATMSQVGSEIGAMTTLGAAVEGHLPKAEDFVVAGLLIGGMHGMSHGAGKLRQMYAKTGVKPAEIIEQAKTDPVLKQEIVSDFKPEILGEKIEIKGEQKAFATSEGPLGPVNETLSFPKPKTEVVKAEKVELHNADLPRSESELAVLSRVGEKVKTTEKLVDLEKVYTNVIDDLNPIKQVIKELSDGTLPAGENPYIAARLYRGWHGKMERILKFGTFDFKTSSKSTGEGLGAILKDIQDKDGFTAYALSKRAIEKSAQKIETGIPLEAAQKVVAEGGAKYQKQLDRLVGFQNRMMDYAVESGLLSEATAAKMKEMNKDYVPFHRIQEGDPLAASAGSRGLFKKMTGSESKIVDPINTIFHNTAAIIRATERNRVYESLVSMAEKSNRMGEFFEKTKAKMKPIKITEKEVAKLFDDLGLDPELQAEAFTVFRPRDHLIKDNEFVLKRAGKTEVYRTKPEIAEALNALDAQTGLTSMWAKLVFGLPAKALRLGVTSTPDFIIRNGLGDQFTAGIQSKFRQIPFADVIQSVGSFMKKDKLWQDFLSSGGASGGFAEAVRYIETDVWKLNQQTGFLNSTYNVIKSPIQALGAMSQLVETLPRLTEFRKGGGTPEAAYSARNVTVDFARDGAKSRALSAMVPFLNVGKQSIDIVARELTGPNKYKVMANATAMVTMPSVLLWWANKDDSRYVDAPNWQKDLYWIIPTDKWEPAQNVQELERPADLKRKNSKGEWEVNNGATYRVMKPFQYGILFGSLVERSLDAFYKEKGIDALSGLGETIAGAVVPNVVPTVVQPMVEQRFNESFFTQKPIVPNHLEDVAPEYQYSEYTSETAKQLGKLIGAVPFVNDFGPKGAKIASPMVIDNYIRAWGGTLGQYALGIADKGLTATGIADTKAERPAATLADIPFIKSFVVRHPSAQAQVIQDFYDNYEKSQVTRNTIKSLIKRGEIDEAMEFANGNLDSVASLEGIRRTLYNHNVLIHKVNASKDYSAIEKRQLIDGFYYRMIDVARTGNQIVKDLKKARKENADSNNAQ